MEEAPLQFIDTWDFWAQIVSIVLFSIGVLMLAVHVVRLIATKDAKTKYDYINRSEINVLWYSTVFIIAAIAFLLNAFIEQIGLFWFVIRAFSTLSASFILGTVIKQMYKFYYPFYIEKRLKKLRYTPRISPKTGKPMKLLSEEEEDVYLDEGMQAEEEVFSIDYDVWVDEESGFTKIERYSGHLHAMKCPECNYQTFKIAREEIVREPTSTEEGELIKHHSCGYCGFKSQSSHRIGALEDAQKKQLAASS